MSHIDDELEFHIEMQTRRYIEAGMDPVAARAKAMTRMGLSLIPISEPTRPY